MDTAKVYFKKDVIIIEHPERVSREAGDKLTIEINQLVEQRVSSNKQLIIINELSKTNLLDAKWKEYQETSVDFMKNVKKYSPIIIVIMSNPLLRIIGGTIAVLSGQKQHFVKSMEEAENHVRSLGFSV